MNSEEKNRRAVKKYIALAIPPVGKAMGRVGRCVNAISSPERLPSVFLPCYPENLQDFSGVSRLGARKLALKNRPKQGRLLGFSGHPKRKRHAIKRIHPPNTAFYADVGNPTPHRPTPQLTDVNLRKSEYVTAHLSTRTVHANSRTKKQPRQPFARSSGLTLRIKLISLLKTT